MPLGYQGVNFSSCPFPDENADVCQSCSGRSSYLASFPHFGMCAPLIPSKCPLGLERLGLLCFSICPFPLSTSAEPKCILDPLLPIPLHLSAHSRLNMGIWYSNGLHHLWCCTPSCYTINNACTCRLCGERQPTKSHLPFMQEPQLWPDTSLLHPWM